MTGDQTSDVVERRLEAVMTELARVSGGASLCTISRSSGPVDGPKYLEGRMAVLSELRRAIRSSPDAELSSLMDPMLMRWRHELAIQVELGSARGWIAYRAGGVDELEALTASTAS